METKRNPEQQSLLKKKKKDFKIKNNIRDKEVSIKKEDIKIVDIYAPNIGALQNIKQRLTGLRDEIDSNAIIVGDFNTTITPMNRS